MLPNDAVLRMVDFGASDRITDRNRSALDPLSARRHARFPSPAAATLTGEDVDADNAFDREVRSLPERRSQAPTRQAQMAFAEDWLLGRLQPRKIEGRLLARSLPCEFDPRVVAAAAPPRLYRIDSRGTALSTRSR